MVNQKEFLERFTGAIETEFSSSPGKPLPWAPGHPKQWSSARAAIQLGQETQSTPTLSANEELLAVGVGQDVHVYRVATQERLAVLKGHTDVVEAVHFSNQTTADGARLLVSHSGVVLGDASQVVLWKLCSDGVSVVGEQVETFGAQLGLYGSSVFTPDGRLLFISNNASTQFDEEDSIFRDAESLPTIHLWDIAGKTTLLQLRGHTDAIQCVTVSSDGTLLASAAWDGTARIWDAVTGACLKVLGPFDGGQLWSVAFSPSGKQVAISQESPWGRVHVCEVNSGRTLSTVKFHMWTRSLAWSPDGSKVACGADPGTVTVWDPLTSEELMRWALKLDDFGMGTMAMPRGLRFLGQDKIVFQLNEGTVYLYDLAGHQKYQFGRGPEDRQSKFPRAEMACSARLVVIPDTDGVLRLFDL
ncbi:hypothetical protein SEUCBS139899_010826 [Sporothrix eucalyptigena]